MILIYTIFEFAVAGFETALLFFYLRNLFPGEHRPAPILACAFAAFGIGLGVLSVAPISPIIRLIYSWGGLLLLSLLLFSSSFLHALYASTSFCVIAILTELLCMKLLSFLGWTDMEVMSSGYQRAIYIILAKILQLIFVLIAAALMGKEHSSIHMRELIPLLPCQIFSIYLCDNLLRYAAKTSGESAINLILILIGILYTNIIIIIYAEVVKSRQRAKHTADLQKQQYALQAGYYAQLYQEQEKTRALWHDMSKCFDAMKSLTEASAGPSAQKILEDAGDAFSSLGKLVDVGNPEISAILNHYIQESERLEVPVALSAWVPPSCAVSPMDLCIIIGNTFENALEACLALPPEQRKISLQINVRNNLFFYEITNTCHPGEKHRLKKAHAYHGYGLSNVKATVDKYQGSIGIADGESGIYTVSIVLNLCTAS